MERLVPASKVEICKSETTQLHLPQKNIKRPQTVPLSILDATTAKFRTTAVVWFYEAASSSAKDTVVNPLSVSQLHCSLLETLSSYPWLTGRLDWAHSVESPFEAGSHDKRFRRIAAIYNDPTTDYGASFTQASCNSHSLSDLIPPPHERPPQWDPTSTGWTSDQFLPDLTTLALFRFPLTEGHCLGVKITTFKCGGIAIGIAISHQIADALSVTNLMRDWSRVNAAMVKGSAIPRLSPRFEPSLVDHKASGDIEASSPDHDIVARARSLPMLRYDRWVDKDGKTRVDKLPPELQSNQHLLPPHDIAVPWETWQFDSPTLYRVLHFTRQEIENMYKSATTAETQNHNSTAAIPSPPTRHDVLLAHLWQCVNVARETLLNYDPASKVLLTMTMGLRARLSLPASFVGSPILTTYISRTVGDFAATNMDEGYPEKTNCQLGDIASDIHRVQSLFTASAIGDALHDTAFDICPHRIWQCMCGSTHMLTTSWIHTHTYDDMDFGCEVIPWYVHPGVHKPDGQVIILEARPGDNTTDPDKWYHRGVDIGISLQESVMQNMLSSGMLRRWQVWQSTLTNQSEMITQNYPKKPVQSRQTL